MKLATALTILDKPKHKQIAFKRALELQAQAGTALTLAGFCFDAAVDSKHYFDMDERRAMRKQLLADRKAWIGELAETSQDCSAKVAWTDDIAEWVASELAESPRDLVIKSVHQSKTLMHTPLDWQLLRTCPAPVLLASTKRRKPSGRVLAAVDLHSKDRTHQRLNRKVLAAANQFAEMRGAKLHCVSALEISHVLRDLDIIDERAAKKRLLAKSQDLLENLFEPYDIPKSRQHYPVGKVGQVVSQIGRKINADLLVVGSCSHRVRQLVGLSNSAEKIVARATCDVLAVHP